MKFTESHEWIDMKGDIGKVGVTSYAQKELGDIVYVELPPVGRVFKSGEQTCVLESTKAAVDVYTPVSGEIVEVNEKLKQESGLINRSPEADGWIFKVKLNNPSELDKLMDQEHYLQMIRK